MLPFLTNKYVTTILLLTIRLLLYIAPSTFSTTFEIGYMVLFVAILIAQTKHITKKRDFLVTIKYLLKKLSGIILVLAAFDVAINLLLTPNDTPIVIVAILFTSINIHLILLIFISLANVIVYSLKKQ